ncbi:hypothetical protein GKZ28_19770 [Clostridium chromiireducens]|uniref:Uncharacterized protein n=1 Tax=Clostridium chromiireducens TaxID=225345 RepID=A0A964W414_9CLOT|nr:hypothetical protein [Clostridium chromiireducens]MVX65920.1 hypothetical protein [Clostridium chromiireducens]
MEKGDKEYLLIEKAYELFKNYSMENSERVQGGRECVDELHKSLEVWDGISSLDDIIEKCLLGKKAEFVAAGGRGGKAGQKDFYIFMNMKSAKEAIKRLIQIKRNACFIVDGKVNYKVIKDIQNEGLLNLLENYTPEVSNKPKILVQRFLCMLFNDVFTSTADYAETLKIARKMDIISHSRKSSDLEYYKYFELFQYEIRYKVEEYFSIKGEDVDNHVKFSVAWSIKDVNVA